jgi:hypothetical protein
MIIAVWQLGVKGIGSSYKGKYRGDWFSETA